MNEPTGIVVVTECNRPLHLKVCLQSIRRARNRWPVFVTIDGRQQNIDFSGCRALADNWITFPRHVGVLQHMIRSLELATNIGYEYIMWLEGDMMVRSDLFDAVGRRLPLDGLLSLSSEASAVLNEYGEFWFCPLGNVANSSFLHKMVVYAKSMAWVGKQRPGHDQVMTESYPGYDAIFCRFMVDHKLRSSYMDKSYVGHFGTVGQNTHCHGVLQAFDRGDEITWLDAVASEFDHEKANAFVPQDFVYG